MICDGDFDDHVDELYQQDLRGWSMRRGHCRRLNASRGRESLRGRAVFARSVNTQSRMDGRRASFDLEAVVKQRRKAVHQLCELMKGGRESFEAWQDHSHECCMVVAHNETDMQCSELEFGSAWFEPELEVEVLQALPCPPVLVRATSTPHTAAELCTASRCVASAGVPLHAWLTSALLLARSPWDQAMARAACAAESYRGSTPGTGTNQQPRRRGKAMVEEASGSFFALQRSFMHQHGSELRRDLSAAFDGPVELNAAPISQAVAARFMNFCSKAGGAELVPVYHGTNAKNHTSIFARGLLVPGHGNDVKVRNGLSHGTGIYTSKIGSAWLSRGFCTEPRVLVCGLWDDAVPVTVTKVLGNFQVTKESDSVRHIGAAIVVFDANRLVPLFEATARPRSQPSQLSRVLEAVDQQSGQIPRAQHSRKPCAKKFESAVVAFLARRAAMKRRT
mmetsp:Transcript_82850/g.238035  ORF Transcript_82850/g.238035 Transcript_82850/m.238035 type:complete len:450 (-) Transcript_82850:229-1578(-)